MLLVFFLLLTMPRVQAQETASVEPSPVLTASSASHVTVAVPEPTQKAMRYYRSGNFLWVIAQFWGLAVPALILFTGFSARMRTWAQRIGRKWFFIIAVYFALFTIVSFALELPLAFYAGFLRQHAYGLSNQTLEKWWGDALKGLLVTVILGAAILWAPYGLIRKSPRRWWLYTGLAALPFLFFMAFIVPIWVEPLFNTFGPMKDKALETKILALAERAGIEGGDVLEVDKSVDTKALNAYVTGVGGTKRIVLWDTIIAKLNEDELLAVMGHEMGHYVLGHVRSTLIFIWLLIVLALYLIHRLAEGLIRRYQSCFGFDRLSDVASLPLVLLLIQVLTILVLPLIMGYSRHNEHEADRFALELLQNNRAAATAFVKLQAENLSNPRPGPLFTLWRGSHPSIGNRIDFCNSYKPWTTGQALRYGTLFRPSGPPRTEAGGGP